MARRWLAALLPCAALAVLGACSRPAPTQPAPAPGATAPAGAETEERLTGDYLGQPLPGERPQVFAGGIVSTGLSERDLTMTPDGNEIYFSAQIGRDSNFSAIVVVRRIDGEWVWPAIAPFSGQFFDLEPAIAPDGSRMYFVSNRPKPGATGPVSDEDIWVMDREGEGWSEPRNLGAPVNTDRPEFFPSLTRDGTLYFTASDAEGTELIFRARPVAGGFGKPERLGPQVNTGTGRFNAFIAPDESFLIFSSYGREDSLGGVDYYVAFRTPQDKWSDPINLGERVNRPSGAEWSASLSPDGKQLFFMSSRSVFVDRRAPRPMNYAELRQLSDLAMNGNADIWWVDAGFVEKLRPEGF